MKYLNTYEIKKYPNTKFYWAYESKDFKVHKIITGPNKDKISFRFYDKSNDNYSIKCSTILGCAKVVDTKYENDENLRSIEIGGDKFRRVYINSVEAIIRLFIIDEFSKDFFNSKYFDFKRLINIFGSIFGKVLRDAKNIGNVIDNLKILKQKMLKMEEENFKKWKFENDTKKYNL